ncbi:zf-C3HC4_2 domain-containing protein [Cephalotus follicularis]|uniref:E3 ubiquitin-protein ligase RMA n=1 Tax=Cephalotus follicularis TaxID=3775 RepID=A0A1Q3D118_CEPFO|nr:zf-C3HC4_2 domain-containing protein [Cephalotus follicularis]
MEQNLFEPEAYLELHDDVSPKKKWSPVPDPARVSENDSGSFDCNICLDSAHDPVVTLCGHLYCWPCIYKWLNVQNSFLEADQQQRKCPVCKAIISDTSLVPLYGHSKSPSASKSKKPNLGAVIPRRPPPSAMSASFNSPTISSFPPNQQFQPNLFHPRSHSIHHQQYLPNPFGGYATINSSNLVGTTTASLFNPTIGTFGEMVFARIFGTTDTSLFTYPHSNSYPLSGSSSPRMRRQELQLEKSLSRVTIFLFLCVMLCLLVF